MVEKKYALITGGSSGLGFAIAENLAGKGYESIIIARNKDKIDEAVKNLEKAGFKVYGFQADITSPEELEKVRDIIKDRFGFVDFLVLNAGVVSVSLLSDYNDYEKLKKDIDIDLWGTVLSAKVFLPLLRSGSKILMISSGFGLIGAAGYSTYCAAKAGVVNFAEALRRELLSKKISVYAACPADIDTPQLAEETRSMPEWMAKAVTARKSLLSPKKAAEKILNKCEGNKFLININFEISLLCFFNKVLPGRLVRAILDFSLPRP